MRRLFADTFWLAVVTGLVLFATSAECGKPWMRYQQLSLQEALHKAPVVDAVVLVVGNKRPSRRTANQPLLRFSPKAALLVPAPVQRLLSQGMNQLGRLRASCRFGLELGVLQTQDAAAGPGPLVVFDASSGQVLLSQAVLETLQSTPLHVVSTATQAAAMAAQHLVHTAGQVLPTGLAQLLEHASAAAAAGIATAFLMAVPKWFCFVCPIVLGLLAPLVINAGVGEAADMACKALQLTDDECVELWFAALALGMILAILSTIPIYKVCRLYECSHPGPPSKALAA